MSYQPNNYYYEEQEERSSSLSKLIKSINIKYLILFVVIILIALYLVNLRTETAMEKAAPTFNSAEEASLYYQEQESKQNKKLFWYIGIGAVAFIILLLVTYKKESGEIDYLEAVDIVKKTVEKLQMYPESYPSDLPQGKFILTMGADLHPMPTDWGKGFRFEVGFAILEENGAKQYYTAKVKPNKGDARLVAFTSRLDQVYTGEELYREPVAVPVDKIDKWNDWKDKQQFLLQRGIIK